MIDLRNLGRQYARPTLAMIVQSDVVYFDSAKRRICPAIGHKTQLRY
jgi:hypothetical protein